MIIMQSKTVTERELVQTCMEEVCKGAGFANPGDMVQRDIEFLCESIENKTGILISLSTIKRLLNGQFARLPQIATLNAIAVFSGYQNWQDYKFTKSRQGGMEVQSESGVGEEKEEPRVIERKKLGYAKLLLAGTVLLLAAAGLLAIMKAGKTGLGNIKKAQFSAVKVTNNDIPNTVVFSYNIDDINADSFFIQQSWDVSRRVRIYKHNHTLTDIYYEPGYHNAKLIANDKIIKTVDVSIPTDKWFFYSKENVLRGRPKYITSTKGISKGSLQLTKDDLLKSNIDIQKENGYIQVYFPSKIERCSDNFVLKFKIRVNGLNNENCPWFWPEVFCQRNFMYFISTLKGCTSNINAQFGENIFRGKTTDFSALGVDVKTWQNVELKVINKNVSISMNGVEVFKTAYQQSCGLITGIGFISNALSEVDYVDLRTADGKIIYSNDFSK